MSADIRKKDQPFKLFVERSLSKKIWPEFNVYVLGHGLDIFTPIFMWTKPPSYAEITKDAIVSDVKITKNLLIKNRNNCEDYDDKGYSGL